MTAATVTESTGNGGTAQTGIAGGAMTGGIEATGTEATEATETGIEIGTGTGIEEIATETENGTVNSMTVHVARIMTRTGEETDLRAMKIMEEGIVVVEMVETAAEAEEKEWERLREASGWDVHAPGYEQYTAMQAKQTGLFNLPGANRTQIPPILGIPGLPAPLPVQTFGMGMGSNPNLSRQSRRLYIGSITPEVNEQNLAEFFNQKMAEMNIGTGAPGNPVLAVQCNYEKNYAFVEFRSAEDATSAMAFDGIIFINGPLKIRRPKDYGGDAITQQPNVHVPGVVSTNVPDSINKIFVGGLPTYLNEENVMELLKSFGELKAFNLVRENGNGPSKGFAFFEYVDDSVTDVAIQSLNGMELGDRYLVVQRASVGAKTGAGGLIPNPDIPYDAMPEVPRPIMPAGQESNSTARILLMLNMVTPEDLVDDNEYGDLYEDVKEECSNFGPLEDLRIPRPIKKDKKWAPGDGMDPLAAARADEAAGVGRVYVKYVDADGASRALKSLAGRSFAGRSIVATLLSEDSQTTPPLNLIFAPQPEAPPPLPSS
ncbi:hypothetical protein V5O48_012654 [Marasmius crinis-equi]|uniref:Splicing factor U2AF subunit n=1 Tax=Marasmius crinis-equi TaxID=585013 RepID=A0ABR3F2A5_9AGAR